MRRIIRFAIAGVCAIILLVTGAYASNLKVLFNGRLLNNGEAIIYNDRTYLPVRTLTNLMGIHVTWIEKESTVDLRNDDSIFGVAIKVASCLKNKDYQLLSTYVHPTEGVVFLAHNRYWNDTEVIDSSKRKEYVKDQFDNVYYRFLPDAISKLSHDDRRVYFWGSDDGRGPYIGTFNEFYNLILYNRDYLVKSNAIVINEGVRGLGFNLDTAFGNTATCVGLSIYNSSENVSDFSSLLLVFKRYQGDWRLICIGNDHWVP